MGTRIKTLSTLAAVAVLVGIVLVAISQIRSRNPQSQGIPEHQGAPISAGEKAAPFKLVDLSGRTVSLSDLHGKVVFLNVWATWCAPCREEMPSMETLWERMRSNKGFVMLAVSQDTGARDEVAAYVAKHGYQFDVLLDPKNDVAEAYRVTGVPETFIIDRAGRIVAHHSGAFDWAQPGIEDALVELLNDDKGTTTKG
jgi:peroxiredoxin